MTRLHRMRLPFHRRFNWELVLRANRRVPLLVLITILTGLIMWLGDQYLKEHDGRVGDKLSRISMLSDAVAAANFGAPGFVPTDWREGTATMKR